MKHAGPWIAIVALTLAYLVVYRLVRHFGDRWTERRRRRKRP